MKKYLLLAATTMLFSTNAMATTYPDVDGQSVEVRVGASIIPACTITTDNGTINYGTIFADPDAESISVSMDLSEGEQCEGCIDFDGSNAHMAEISSSCGLLNEQNAVISCINGGTPDEGCDVGETDYKFIPYGFFSQEHGDVTFVSGQLTGPVPDEKVDLDVAVIKVTLSYE